MKKTSHALICAALILLLVACGKKEAPPPAPQVADVTVMTVRTADVPAVFETVGQTESSQQVEIRARVPGFLEKRVYTEGSMVHPGQTLFLIDPKPFQADVDAARAELAQQQARLVTARANLSRVKPLVAQNALSQKDLDDATGQEQAAAASVEAATAKLTNTQLDLGYATIKSPVAGLSSFAKVQDGAYVSGTNSLLTYVAKLDPMRVNFSLSENERLRMQTEVQKGTIRPAPHDRWRVSLVLADGSTFPETGQITFADAAFNQETGTFLLRAEIPNPKGTLRPGQFVRVLVQGATRPNAIVIPQRSVQQGPRGQFAWVVGQDGKAEQRVLETGEWLGDGWLVTNGLHAGERVVVDGALRLAPGLPLKPTDISYEAAMATQSTPVASPAPGGNASGEAAAQATGAAQPAAPSAPAVAAPASTGADTPAATVYFNKDSAQIDATASVLLRQFAAQLPPQHSVVLNGYVDPRGKADANARLARARAQAVERALQEAGIAANRIELKKPADIVGGQDEARARRVDLIAGGAR
jgi:membrane fusion protein, multidrug efflux system